MRLRLNLKESTLFTRLADSRKGRPIIAESGQITCNYPLWLERQMLAFKLWKGQYYEPARKADRQRPVKLGE